MNFSSDLANVTAGTYNDFYRVWTKNVIVAVLCVCINYINGTLVHTFNKHQIFYVNPRYVLFIHLVINDMIQLTVSVILFIVAYIFFSINVCLCCHLVVLAALTTQNTPLNLVVMAAECCVAVCLPLRHAQLCTLRRTYALIGLIWLTSSAAVVPDLLATLATEPLDFFSSRVFCIRNNVFPSTTLATKVWVYNVVFLVLVWLALAYTYFRILFVVKGATSGSKKAQNTILLHGFQLLLCMLTYIAPILKEAMYRWFPQHFATSLFICYIIIQILPRLLSPLVYGLRDQIFRKYLRGHLLCRTRTKPNEGNEGLHKDSVCVSVQGELNKIY